MGGSVKVAREFDGVELGLPVCEDFAAGIR
jgi:hypothetical protein